MNRKTFRYYYVLWNTHEYLPHTAAMYGGPIAYVDIQKRTPIALEYPVWIRVNIPGYIESIKLGHGPINIIFL